MISIGMLHHRKYPEDVNKALACAAIARLKNVDFIYFSYLSIDFENKRIKGFKYLDGEWMQVEATFPNVVINISSPKTVQQSEIGKKLKELVPFTSFPVGNKMKVYKMVKNGKKFADYLIPSLKLKTGNDFLLLMNHYSRVVIKPYSGNKGKKILFLEKLVDNQFLVIDGDMMQTIPEENILSRIKDLIKERNYLIQPYIECKTKAGLTYDFRLHVQKNGLGKWEITLIYPRISGGSKLVSNISSGGYRGELDIFLQEEFKDPLIIKHKLEQFALDFSYHLDKIYQCSFDELGIDVGIDNNQKLWVFEVNWRPGSKHREFEVAKRLIPYAMYLAR